MITKTEIKRIMRIIFKEKDKEDLLLNKEDLLRLIKEKYLMDYFQIIVIDLKDFEESFNELLLDGEIYEKFKQEYLWTN
jgi:hypothetical protein